MKKSVFLKLLIAALTVCMALGCLASCENLLPPGGPNEPAHQHKWKPATCTDPKTCSTCGATEGKAAGHAFIAGICIACGEKDENYHTHSWVDADCDTPKTCSTCGATEGKALGHNFVEGACSRCGEKDENYHTHSWVDADCDTPKTCSTCGATEGKALGHNFVDGACSRCGEKDENYHTHSWVDADCDTPKTCSTCGATEGNALGHSWTDADCDTPKTCSTCGATEGKALGHSWTDADCDTPKTCSTCGATEGNALGHSWTDADCDTPKTCSTCGATEGNALGHDWGNTYTYDIEKHSASCGRCGEKNEGAHSFVEGECQVCGMSNTLTAAEFNEYGSTFAHNKYSSLEYRLTGTIVDILNGGSIVYIRDEGGDEVYLYNLRSADGKTYYGEAIMVGDVITVQTVCGNYNGSPQGKNAKVISAEHKIFDGYISHGESVYMGYYPQTKITAESLIAILNDKAGALPTKADSGLWTDYGYRLYGETYAFMWYIDIKEGADTYRGVYFTNYRPKQSATNTSLSSQHGYNVNTVYWFRYDPLRWDIIKKENGNALLLCDLIIDAQAYYRSTALRSEDTAIYANNYMRSDIRSWLNSDFYDISFTSAQKSLILTTLVSNSVASTGDSTNRYTCLNTEDKVFLMSREEVLNSSLFENADALKKGMTAYARVQGCYYYSSYSTGDWWLRSPHYNSGQNAYIVAYYGSCDYTTVNYTQIGVVPAVWIELE